MRVYGGVVRSALLIAASLSPSREAAASATRAWIAQLISLTGATVDKARFETEVARFIKRKQHPITAQSVARLCGVTARMATKLELVVVKPAVFSPRPPTPTRRAKRMVTTLPQIISIEPAAPWGHQHKRSTWFKRHRDRAKRQVLALRAILESSDTTAIAAARASIASAICDRASQTGEVAPGVDRLLARLTLLLKIHDNGAPAMPDCPAMQVGDVEHTVG